MHTKHNEVKLVEESGVCISIRMSSNLLPALMPCVYMRKTCSCAIEQAFICALDVEQAAASYVLVSSLFVITQFVAHS